MSPQIRSLESYLVVKPKNWSGLSARLTSKVPALGKDEVAIKLDVVVPDALFKRPQLRASVTIPESVVSAPVISAEVLDNIQEILTQQTGLDIKVSVVEPTQII